MADVTITNLTSAPLYIGDLYTTIAASSSIVISRSSSDLPRMAALQAAVAAGNAAVSVALTANEAASGLAATPNTVGADDMLPVASTDPASAEIVIRKAITTVASTDIPIYAANALPYKIRILSAKLVILTVQAGSTLQLFPQAAGAGTAITTATSTAVAGNVDMPMNGNVTSVLTPGATIGLFARPSAHTGMVAELIITARRES